MLLQTRGARLRPEGGGGACALRRRRGRDRAGLARPRLAGQGARRGAGDARKAWRPANAAHAGYLEAPAAAADRPSRRGRARARRHRSRRAAAGLARRATSWSPPASRCGASGPTPARAALDRAEHAARAGRHSRRSSPRSRARRWLLDAAGGAADRRGRGTPSCCFEEVEALLASRRAGRRRLPQRRARRAMRRSRWPAARCCLRSPARWPRPGPAMCRATTLVRAGLPGKRCR